ncbi:MAG TPA: peptidase [Mycobacterium sp.]|jgi:hypothetical protein|nr:peptidase [Mycobacterium sp.]
MRLSITSVVTKRPLLGLLLLAELILAISLLDRLPVNAPAGAPVAAPASLTTPGPPETLTLRDGRTVHLVGLGGPRTEPLLARIAAQMDDAADAVTAFWGRDWRREILIVAAGSDAQFGTLAGGGADTAATTTSERIMFAPGAAGMSDAALRIVLRHELFHYASRADTAADAPRWLTEGVADFVGRPPAPRPENAAQMARLPTDADLDGPQRSLAYDQAWWFSRFVAQEYGAPTLRALYLRACRPGHPDAATAVRDTLGADLDAVLTRWRQWLSGEDG